MTPIAMTSTATIRLIATLPLLFALAAPVFAAAGQVSRSEPVQTRKSDYWLSRDMQRLVFWQAHATETRAATPR